MNVGELFHSLDRDKVLDFVDAHYEDLRNRPGYERAWDAILKLQPALTDMNCRLWMLVEEEDGERHEAVMVDGIGKKDGQKFGIELVPWEEWLSMDIVDGLDLPAEQILGHVIYEMTWAGFDAATVEGTASALRDKVEEIQALHPQQQKTAQKPSLN